MQRLDSFQSYGSSVIYVGNRNTITQTVVPQHDGLVGVRFQVYNPNLGGPRNYFLKILDESGSSLRLMPVTESNLGWGDEFRFDFPPIYPSRGRPFIFEFSSFQSESAGDVADGSLLLKSNENQLWNRDITKLEATKSDTVKKTSIGVAYDPVNRYSDGTGLLNNRPFSGDLKFELYYSVSAGGFLRDSAGDFFRRTEQSRGFFIVYGLIFVFLILMVVIRIKHLKTGQR